MQRLGSIVTGALALAAVSTAAIADEAENRALARDFYAAFNARNFDALEGFVAATVISHTEASPSGGLPALRDEMIELVAAMPDVRLTVEIVLASGDYVTVISNLRGTEGGAMPAHQQIIDYTLVDVWLVSEGMLAELWRATDD